MAKLGLVCLTSDKKISFRTVQKTRLDQLKAVDQYKVLYDVYTSNKRKLREAILYCIENKIGMYRISSEMFPFSDTFIGKQVLKELVIGLDELGKLIIKYNIRITCHPGQYTTLTSERVESVRMSIDHLHAQALIFEYMGLPEDYWTPIMIHGGKKDRLPQLVDTVNKLPTAVHSRLVLENDEYSYSVDDLLSIQQILRIPIVYDVHHHIINRKLESYTDTAIQMALDATRSTWPDPSMQLVHLSNGRTGMYDRAHSDLISYIPIGYFNVPWIEVEAKGKELAINALREMYPGVLV